MMYRTLSTLTIVFFLFSTALSAEEKPEGDKPKTSSKVFELKQSYRPLSPYKPIPAAPAKTLAQLSKKQQKKITKLEKSLKKNPDSITRRKKLARAYYKNSMYEKVVETLLAYNHELGKVDRLLLSKSLELRNMHSEQVKVLKFIADENKNDYKTHYELGRVYYLLRNADLAIDSFRSSISLNKKYSPAYRDLKRLFEETENDYESRELLKTMVELFGEKPDYLTRLCRLYSLDNFYSVAIKYCNRAYRVNKSDKESLSYLGINYEKDGQEDLAKKSLMIAARKYKKTEFAQWAAGDWFFIKQNYHVSLKYFKAALKADATSARSTLGAAQSSYEIKKYRNSLALFIKACALNQKLTIPHFQVATAKMRSHKDYDLKSAFESAYTKCRHNKLK